MANILKIARDFNPVIALKNIFNKIDELIERINFVSPVTYKKYVALLTQTGTDAPVATVLENTLGLTITWDYVSTGNYNGLATGLFVNGKTYVMIGQNVDNLDGINFAYPVGDDNNIRVKSNDVDMTTGLDDKLYYTSIEIRVYS